MSTGTLTHLDTGSWLLQNNRSVHYYCFACYPDSSTAKVALCGTPRPPGTTKSPANCIVCEDLASQPCSKCGDTGGPVDDA